MENGIYTGVIIYFHTENHFTIETTLCAAKTRAEALLNFTKYAENCAEKNQLKFITKQILMQKQDESRVSRALYLARAGLSESEAESINGDGQTKADAANYLM